MGRCPKGRDSDSKSPVDVPRQSKMSSFFQVRCEVAPMFKKPQKSKGGSAAGGVGGTQSANAGSTSRLAGAAGRGGAEPETILVDDYDAGVG
eukprot:2316416-Rhodomonas_salina.1